MDLMINPTSNPSQPTTIAPTSVSFNQSLPRLSTPSSKDRASRIINKFINSNWMSRKKPAVKFSNSNQPSVSFPVPPSSMFDLHDNYMNFEEGEDENEVNEVEVPSKLLSDVPTAKSTSNNSMDSQQPQFISQSPFNDPLISNANLLPFATFHTSSPRTLNSVHLSYRESSHFSRTIIELFINCCQPFVSKFLVQWAIKILFHHQTVFRHH